MANNTSPKEDLKLPEERKSLPIRMTEIGGIWKRIKADVEALAESISQVTCDRDSIFAAFAAAEALTPIWKKLDEVVAEHDREIEVRCARFASAPGGPIAVAAVTCKYTGCTASVSNTISVCARHQDEYCYECRKFGRSTEVYQTSMTDTDGHKVARRVTRCMYCHMRTEHDL
jgi:hypothetical protein